MNLWKRLINWISDPRYTRKGALVAIDKPKTPGPPPPKGQGVKTVYVDVHVTDKR